MSESRRTPLARAGRVLRERGVRAALARAVTATVLRRLLLYERLLDDGMPRPELRLPLEVQPVEPEDFEELLAARPDLSRGELEARRSRGVAIVCARHEGRIVYSSFWCTGAAWIEYLHFRMPLAPDEVYVFDASVDPALRRHGLGLGLWFRILADYRSRGFRRALSTVEPENTAPMEAARRRRPIGRLVSVGIGPWRRTRMRMEPGERAPGASPEPPLRSASPLPR